MGSYLHPLRARRPHKSARRGDGWMTLLRGLAGIFLSLYLGWTLLFPERSGSFGIWLSGLLRQGFGRSSLLLSLLLLNGVVRGLLNEAKGGWAMMSAASFFFLAAAAAGSELAARGLGLAGNYGGALGAAVGAGLSALLGGFFGFLACLLVALVSLQVLWNIRWSSVFSYAVEAVSRDIREWNNSRRELSTGSAAEPPSAPEPEKAPEAPAWTPPPARAVPSAPAAEAPEKAPKAAKPTAAPISNYQLPSTQLLAPVPASSDRGRPAQAEIVAAAAHLEATLKSFNVEARVSGYSPGPVITRYELSPAPGVKVSSIVALGQDIALAMRAKGIRIIAPIPGKAAVGVEIPNSHPASVVLREILESGALPPTAGPLSFAIGLSADGEPLAADLQKMPHLLVAGATNSGKSVLIHSLILSILFRARPDEVKFLFIDPKRLELTFYENIPHLFDPTTPAEKAAVLTQPREASKSLTAMVKVMERRYEKFQRYGVRNIDSYNAEADLRGEPREFFIVVVIDELADLMLVAQDVVEDSIQRLAQMARAVGIHLVLATQRPSVDVITGVIKANLPCRIALQVISRIDSKVILDASGAESLQGKGDLLYLASGAQKAERGQGAYVSEAEIKRVVEHLRGQGRPSYEPMEAPTTALLESDLKTYGVEPLEFSQALKLVLDRKRVSQDLLKSQFGSSARATNLLSLLEVKGLIRKPEGSNRWEIDFDQIVDTLRKHFPQVPLGNGPSHSNDE